MGRKVFIFKSFKSSHPNHRGEILLVLLIHKQLMKHKIQNSSNCVTEVTLQWKNLPRPFQGVLSANPGHRPRQATERISGWQRSQRANGIQVCSATENINELVSPAPSSWSGHDLRAQVGLQFPGVGRELPTHQTEVYRQLQQLKHNRCTTIL